MADSHVLADPTTGGPVLVPVGTPTRQGPIGGVSGDAADSDRERAVVSAP